MSKIPKIYISLPSSGHDMTRQLPIYSMSAKDDIYVCTPDALMNGQTTIQIIKNCCPDISDPESLTLADINTILVGIKIATDDDDSTVQLKCHDCKETNDFALNMQNYLYGPNLNGWQDIIFPHIIVKIEPPKYRKINEWNIHDFRIAKQLYQIQYIEDPIQRDELLFPLLDRRNDLNMERYVESIQSINGVEDKHSIGEFLKFVDAKIAQTIRERIDTAHEGEKLGTVDLQCPKCKQKFTLPLDLDFSSNFRSHLIMSSDEDIVELLNKLNKQQAGIRQDLLRTIWYMRGSIQNSEVYDLTRSEREQIGKLIEENAEASKKSGFPII